MTYGLRGLAAFGLTLSLAAGSALAQGNNAQPAPAANQNVADRDVPGPIDSLQDLQDTGKMAFKMADTNNDNQISQKEALDAANLLVGGFFFRADANGDGTISADEAKQARDSLLQQKPWLRYVFQKAREGNAGNNANAGSPNPAQGLANLLDSNNDKQLQAAEVRQAVQTAVQGGFAAADTNRDGQLSPSELNAAVAGAINTAAQAGFRAADKDNNGQLSQDEFLNSLAGPARGAFQVLDANNDNQLSPQELQAAQRVIASQIRNLQVPEPNNSPASLIRSGQAPAQAAPVPGVNAAPGQPAPATTAPAQPR